MIKSPYPSEIPRIKLEVIYGVVLNPLSTGREKPKSATPAVKIPIPIETKIHRISYISANCNIMLTSITAQIAFRERLILY